MSLHTSVTELAEQRGIRQETRVRVGDIVQLVWQRRLVYARVLSWSGQPDGLCRLIDLRCQVHRRFVDSLSRVPADELPALRLKFDALLASKRGQAAAKPVKSDWQEPPQSGRGQLSVHDEPLKLTEGMSSEPTKQLLDYCGVGRAERRYLETLRQRDSATYRRTIIGSYPGQRRYDGAA